MTDITRMIHGPWMLFSGVIVPLSNGNARIAPDGRLCGLILIVEVPGFEAANDGVVMGVVS